MYPRNLTSGAKLVLVQPATAGGTGDVTSAEVDLGEGGFDAVTFLTTLAAPAANNTLHAQMSSDGATWADVESSLVVSGAEPTLWLELHQPKETRVRVVITRAATTAVGEIYALLYRARKMPAANVRAGITGRLLNAPIGGTP